MEYTSEQKLLATLYDAKDQMEKLQLPEVEIYIMISELIKSLETFLQTNQDIL